MTSGEISRVFKKEKNCLVRLARGRLSPLGSKTSHGLWELFRYLSLPKALSYNTEWISSDQCLHFHGGDIGRDGVIQLYYGTNSIWVLAIEVLDWEKMNSFLRVTGHPLISVHGLKWEVIDVRLMIPCLSHSGLSEVCIYWFLLFFILFIW